MVGWAIVTLCCLFSMVARGVRGAPVAPFAESRLVDINRASIPELMTLPGIGRTRAAEVVLYRVRRGRFASVEGLLEVDGIGPLTLAEMRGYLVDVGRSGN